jgi:hypothetical protein
LLRRSSIALESSKLSVNFIVELRHYGVRSASHTAVLRDGAMPPSLLETKIDKWIDSQLM